MPSSATVTGKTGPDRTVTAQVHSDVKEFTLVLGGKSLMRIQDAVKGICEFDLQPMTTITITIAAGNATITAS